MQDSVEGSVSVAKQRTGSIGDRPSRPTLLEQVLNKKRLVSFVSLEVLKSGSVTMFVTLVKDQDQSDVHALRLHVFKLEVHCKADVSWPLCKGNWKTKFYNHCYIN